jgi:hypothetical protein
MGELLHAVHGFSSQNFANGRSGGAAAKGEHLRRGAASGVVRASGAPPQHRITIVP